MGRIPEQDGQQHQPTEVTTPPEIAQTWEETVAEMMRHEAAEWQRTLGAKVDVPPVPDSITAEVLENLRVNNFQLVYIPALDLRPPESDNDDISDPNHYRFFNILIPHLRTIMPKLGSPFLLDFDWKNPEIARNLDSHFFIAVHNQYTDFPKTSGEWTAVECHKCIYPGTTPDPSSEIFKTLGLGTSRYTHSNSQIRASLETNGQTVLSGVGLDAGQLRLPTVLELNLLGNRFKLWEEATSFEHTSTATVNDDNRLRTVLSWYLKIVDGDLDKLDNRLVELIAWHCTKTGDTPESIRANYQQKFTKDAYYSLGNAWEGGAANTGFTLADDGTTSIGFRMLMSGF